MKPRTTDIARRDLFEPEEELRRRYDPGRVQRLLRLRHLYTSMLATPEQSDRRFVEDLHEQYGISLRQAYDDLHAVKELLPKLSETSRDYHRHRFNEMIMDVYRQAKEQGDIRTMERAAGDYARYNRIDQIDDDRLPYEEIVVQPFIPSADPALIGIKPLENIEEVKRRLLKQLGEYNPDIEEVEYQEADLPQTARKE